MFTDSARVPDGGLMSFHELQTLKCPTDESFQFHLGIWDEIKAVAESQNCTFKWKILSKKEKTFQLNVKGGSKQDHLNGLIEVMKMLAEKGIEPAIIIKTENLGDGADRILKDMREVIDA
ncbi:hypothetical protein [uncultured Mediterranean phage uvMED]|nr:hypothetical protein [uncultured Mediterranean phage uvMED]